MYHNEEIIEMGGCVAYHMVRLWLWDAWAEWKAGQAERVRVSDGEQRQDDWIDIGRFKLSIEQANEWSKSIGLMDDTGVWLSPKVGPDEFLVRWVEAIELIPVGWRCKVLSACLVSPWEMGWCGYDHTQMDLYERVRRVAEGEADIRLVEREARIVKDSLWSYRVASEMAVDKIVEHEEKQAQLEATILEHKARRDEAMERMMARNEEVARRTAELQAQARELQQAAEVRERLERARRDAEKAAAAEEREREREEKRQAKEFEKEQKRVQRLIAAEEKRRKREEEKKQEMEERAVRNKMRKEAMDEEIAEKRVLKEGMEIANRLLRTSGVYKHLGWRAEVRAREAERDAEKRARVIRRLGLKEADCNGVSTKALLEVWHKQARERRGG